MNHTDSQRQRGKRVKVEREVVACHPPHNHNKRDGKDCDLNGRADCHTQAQVHLVLHSHHNSSDVLAGVAGNGQHNDAQEGLAEARFRAELFEGAAQVPAGTAAVAAAAPAAQLTMTTYMQENIFELCTLRVLDKSVMVLLL